MTVDIEKLKALALAATPGPWEVDTVKSEGHYGTDEDGGYGFMGYAIIDEEGRPLMDSLNRDQSEIHEDYDGEELYAWDELAKRDAAFVAGANPAAVLELIAEVERLRADREAAVKEAWRANAELSALKSAAPAAGTVEKDATYCVLKSIIEDGYLSDTNTARGHAAIDAHNARREKA
jgi:hypothetical protein